VEKPVIFISCGQWTDSERTLGKKIAEFITSQTSYEAYFAQNQSGLEGLTTHILGALDRAAGFLGILHHRGTFTDLEGRRITRASVWIEQEIAIAAYMKQIARRQIDIRLFVQRGIALEGVRQHLIANPIFFDSDSDVLAEIPMVLGKWNLQAVNRLTDPRAKQISEWRNGQQKITVRGEQPKGSQALIGNQNWKGEKECLVEECTNFTVFLRVLGSDTNEALPLDLIMISHDTLRHQPMLIVKA